MKSRSSIPVVFVDANVIIDFLAKREPFHEDAFRLFWQAEKGKLKLLTSSNCITTVYYILEKYNGSAEARLLILQLLDHIYVISVNHSAVDKAARDLRFNDFEDAVQYYAVLEEGTAEAILTRNPADYSPSSISVLTPDEWK